MWTKSACVVFAWSILLIMLVVATAESASMTQADTRIASSTEVILTNAVSVAAPVATVKSTATYVVQPGDTLAGISAALAVPGGWRALYAANRGRLGRDPNLIQPGAVLVVPGRTTSRRYTVVAGNTLSGIAAALGLPGGWHALYAANRLVIGADPNVISPGIVLTVPLSQAASPSGSGQGSRTRPAPKPRRRHRSPLRGNTAASTGMPPWMKTLLFAVGLLIGVVVLAQAALVILRRPAAAGPAAPGPGPAVPAPGPAVSAVTGSGGSTAYENPPASGSRVVVADYDRLIVTACQDDDTVYVLRPRDADAAAILRVARLVLPEARYQELAEWLGLPVSWPIVVADHDRLVVTHCSDNDTVYVLRPPGVDPRAVLRVARLVVPEDPYEELAEHLGVPASWPIGQHQEGGT
ncbi:MAG: LysM domain-containing protein [Streptosporangiaceae bacterium]